MRFNQTKQTTEDQKYNSLRLVLWKVWPQVGGIKNTTGTDLGLITQKLKNILIKLCYYYSCRKDWLIATT